MLISVIIPVYNAEKYIHRCIDSIVSQTYTDYELILIDDGSVDNSAKICDEYAKNNDRIKIIHQTNSGPGPSRNNGLSQARGDYVLFVDSDDFIYENTLETLVQAAQKNNYPDGILFDYIMGSVEHNIRRNTLPKAAHGFVDVKNAILNSAGGTCCKMYKTSIIAENSITFPSLPRKEDFVFNKAALSYCNTVFYVKEHLYFYFNNTNSIMHTTSFSENIQQAAFESLTAQISPKHKDLVNVLQINNYLVSAVQDMCINGKRIGEIKQFITEYECSFPDWYGKRTDMVLSKEIKIYMFMIHKKQIFPLKILFPLRKKVKNFYNKKSGA